MFTQTPASNNSLSFSDLQKDICCGFEEKWISNTVLKKQKLKDFIMYYTSSKLWILIDILVPDIRNLLREPGHATSVCQSICFTLHMFHTFQTFTLLANITDQTQHLSSPLPNGKKVQRVIIWQTAHSDLSLGC